MISGQSACCREHGNRRTHTYTLLISEIFGGVNGTSLRFLTRLAHAMKGVTDAPHFDRSGKQVPFFVFHARAISRAAAVGHGEVLLKHAAALARRATALLAASRPPGATAAEGRVPPPPPGLEEYVDAQQGDPMARAFLDSLHLDARRAEGPHAVGA